MFLGNFKYRQKVFSLLTLVFIIISIGVLIIYIVSRNSLLRGHQAQLKLAAHHAEDLMRQKKADMQRLVSFLQNNRAVIEYLYISTVLSGEKEPLKDLIRPIYVSQKIDVLILYDMEGEAVFSLDTRGKDKTERYEEELPVDIIEGFKEANGDIMVVGMGPLKYTGGNVGYALVGKYMDGEFLAEQRDMIGSELLLVKNQAIIASSLQLDKTPYLPHKGKVEIRGNAYSVLEEEIKNPDAKTIGILVTANSDEALLDSLNKLKLSMFTMLGIAGAISFGLAILFIKTLVSPLKEMVSLVDRVGKGEFDRMLEIKGKDEIASLSERFNDMQKQLNAQRDALERYADDLEYKVEERTGELKRVQRQLLQSQKMESMGTLAGGIAHDFNNLLAAILGYSSFVKEELPESHPHYRYWDIIEQAAMRGTELTSHLLTFSKGRVELKAKEPVEVNGIIRELISLMARTLDKSITTELKLLDERLYVMGDPNALYQSLLNICVNARDAMPTGGLLFIETQKFQTDEGFIVGHYQAKAGTYIQINISDTGVGIEKNALERIFEPFFTTKELGRGTGLGLAIVYSVIKEHGGFIDVYSEPGKGTTFKLYLPAYEEEVTPKEEEPLTLEAEIEGQTVLVVDDEESLRRLCKEILEAAGYSVITAGDGVEAIRIFQDKKDTVSLVVLDMVMSGISGRETLRRLRAIEPSIKVLASSGFSREIVTRLAEEKGVRGFIEKPYRSQTLLKKVKEALAMA